jgi:hypothetical protein
MGSTEAINLTNILPEIFGAQVKDCGMCAHLIGILMNFIHGILR